MKCYFVFGLEGSGTYMLHDAIALAGCSPVDNPKSLMDTDLPDKIVTRRSIPHANTFIDHGSLITRYSLYGYNVIPIVIIRSFPASFYSVVRRDPSREGTMQDLYKYSKKILGEILRNYDRSFHVCYSEFVTYPKYREFIFKTMLGLPVPEMDFYDANKKYYE